MVMFGSYLCLCVMGLGASCDIRPLLATVRVSKMRYFGHIMRSNRSCLEKEITQEKEERKKNPC